MQFYVGVKFCMPHFWHNPWNLEKFYNIARKFDGLEIFNCFLILSQWLTATKQ